MAAPTSEDLQHLTPVVAFDSTSRLTAAATKPSSRSLSTWWTRARRVLVGLWLASQVERWGQYSVERMLALDAFSRSTRRRRVLALLCGAFIPSLVVEMILEIIPLSPANRGIEHSGNFWIRSTLQVFVLTYSLVAQFQQSIPGIALTSRHIVIISAVTSMVMQPVALIMSLYIGYPLPFFMVLTSLPWTPIVFGMGFFILRDQLRHDVRVRHAISQFKNLYNAQSLLIIVYPAYSYVFTQSPNQQTWLVLVLPAVKLLFRLWFSNASMHIQDLKPELIVFNVEIFSALYLSSCMQSATTINSTVVIMIVDFLQSTLSIKELKDALDDRKLRRAVGAHTATWQLIPLAQYIVRTNAFVRRHESIQLDTCVEERVSLRALASFRRNSIVPTATTKTLAVHSPIEPVERNPPQIADHTVPSRRPVNDTKQTNSIFTRLHNLLHELAPHHDPEEAAQIAQIASGISDGDKLLVVQKTLRILHFAEFIALIEYSEVIVPIVYSLFMVVAYTFPNRQMYANLKDLDPNEFAGTLGNVLLYGSLELVSYLALNVILQRKFRLSAFTQTAFVLDTQWAMVQSKLLLWLIVVLQFAHELYGSDFSFQFKWLHQTG